MHVRCRFWFVISFLLGNLLFGLILAVFGNILERQKVLINTIL